MYFVFDINKFQKKINDDEENEENSGFGRRLERIDKYLLDKYNDDDSSLLLSKLNTPSEVNNPFFISTNNKKLSYQQRKLFLDKRLWIIPISLNGHFSTITVVNPILCFIEKKENWDILIWDSIRKYHNWAMIYGRIITYVFMVNTIIYIISIYKIYLTNLTIILKYS
jgi:hypothetical protein